MSSPFVRTWMDYTHSYDSQSDIVFQRAYYAWQGKRSSQANDFRWGHSV